MHSTRSSSGRPAARARAAAAAQAAAQAPLASLLWVAMRRCLQCTGGCSSWRRRRGLPLRPRQAAPAPAAARARRRRAVLTWILPRSWTALGATARAACTPCRQASDAGQGLGLGTSQRTLLEVCLCFAILWITAIALALHSCQPVRLAACPLVMFLCCASSHRWSLPWHLTCRWMALARA